MAAAKTTSNYLLKLYNKVLSLPFGGKTAFSYMFCFKAPYFMTIRPRVEELDAGFAKVSMKQRWSVQNHIKTVHAIAVCNLVEMTMGLTAEASIPAHLRWLPMGMNVRYLKKSTGELTATCSIDHEHFFELENYPAEVGLPVEVKNSDGVIVTDATVTLWISEKPKK